MIMDLNLFTERSYKSNFGNDFIKELRDFIEKQRNKGEIKTTISLDELTEEEVSKYETRRDDLLRQYRLDTMDKGDMYVVKTEPPYMYNDRYKIAHIIEDNILEQRTLFFYQLPKGIHKEDVVRRVRR